MSINLIPALQPVGGSPAGIAVPAVGTFAGSKKTTTRPSPSESLVPTQLEPSSSAAQQQQDVTVNKGAQQSQLEDLKKYAEKANNYLRKIDTHLEFQISELTGRVVINVVDTQTSEVLRQIPPDTMQNVADHISHMRGLLFDTRG